ncbi:unnamed protein product [Clonostachys rosea f. rosea IK726]|jgi:opacity protein-like surface antigen|uniref:Uncharacterized protein n=1 Tax=Clonostachys rosea f. rosea IK726 TaxID=1349383 RepID=A0ACA9UK34_BIOOC|nr:unnamed protein product [Clonostachys rosea f. rosea IK726]
MKVFQVSAVLAICATVVVAAPVANPSPEDIDAGSFISRNYVWGSYNDPKRSVVEKRKDVVEKREDEVEVKKREDVDAGSFISRNYVWGSYGNPSKRDGEN